MFAVKHLVKSLPLVHYCTAYNLCRFTSYAAAKNYRRSFTSSASEYSFIVC